MKLLYTPNSPYARVARICAMQQKVDLVYDPVAVREQADVIIEYNPAAIVPTLVLDDGVFLTETRLICEHIQDCGSGGFLAEKNDIYQLHWEGFVTNFLDGVAVWIRELRRPLEEQSPGAIALENHRFIRCIRYFENHWKKVPGDLNYASAMLAGSIELVDTRIALDWRTAHPNMAEWYTEISINELLVATAPEPITQSK